jgi:hypothetical protein
MLFARQTDFKRAFEACGRQVRRIPAAFGLTDLATMLIQSRL